MQRMNIMQAFTTKRQQGITLVELMVSVTVGLVLLSGIISIFVSNKQAYSLQESTNILNENARYALNQVQYHLRMGDHWGGVERDAVEVDAPLGALAIATACTQSPAVSGIGFRGFEGAAASPLDCIPNADYAPNTDILIIPYGEPERVVSATVAASSDIFVRTAIGRRAMIFQGSALAGLPSDMYDASDPDPTPITNYRYHTVIYFIRQCASQDLGAAGVCDGADDTTPTLARLVLDGTNLVQEDIVAGVEQMQITYGILNEAVNPPQISYNSATNITTNNQWSSVDNVQISVIVRGEQFDATFTDTRNFSMYGGFTYTPAVGDQNFRRKLFNFVVQVRNLTRA